MTPFETWAPIGFAAERALKKLRSDREAASEGANVPVAARHTAEREEEPAAEGDDQPRGPPERWPYSDGT